MKPFVKRLSKVFSVLLNVVVALAAALMTYSAIEWANWIASHTAWFSGDCMSGIFVGTMLILSVATVNYLNFGEFRVWNRIVTNSPREDQA